MTKYILDNTPDIYHSHMIPDYPLGCKRPVVERGFLKCLWRSNVRLNFDGIAEIVENGIITKTGEMLPFDVIVYATGFDSERYPMHIRGLNGATVQGYYDAHGGSTAYIGTAIPDAPNFYLIIGPNTGAQTSAILIAEMQVAYILQLMEPVLTGSVSPSKPHPQIHTTPSYKNGSLTRCTYTAPLGCVRTVQARHSICFLGVRHFCGGYFVDRIGIIIRRSALRNGHGQDE
jgi:hypothetical protein